MACSCGALQVFVRVVKKHCCVKEAHNPDCGGFHMNLKGFRSFNCVWLVGSHSLGCACGKQERIDLCICLW